MELLPQDVQLKLISLKRHKKGSGWGSAKPYLWLIYFKIDGEAITLTNEFLLNGAPIFQFSEGSHGNLGIKSMGNTDRVDIPEKIGLWKTTFEPLHIPYFEGKISGALGVMMILMEQNNVSAQGAEAGHQALNSFFKSSFTQLVEDFRPTMINIQDPFKSVMDYFSNGTSGYARKMGAAVGNAVKDNQNIVQNLWSLVNKDNMIGFAVRQFTLPKLIKHQHLNFSKKWETDKYGTWEVFGEISATPFTKEEGIGKKE